MNANLKISAVLVLITGNLCDGNLVLTRRSEKLRNHGGEISFPGGTKEDLDLDLKETALRETFEEINVTGKQINLIDELPEVSTSTGYLMVKQNLLQYTYLKFQILFKSQSLI